MAIPAKTRRSDQIVASHVRAQTFGDIAGERSDGIGAHELGEKRQLALSSVAFEGARPAESADRGLSSVCIVGVR